MTAAAAGPTPSAVPLTPVEAGPLVRRDEKTIRRALGDGRLHGHRPHDVRGGRWLIAEGALYAWATGADESAQRRACGLCAHTRPVSAARGKRGPR